MSSNVLATNSDIDVLEQKTINRARKLIELAEKNQRLIDKSNRRRFKKLFQDQNAISVTVTLTDEVMRIKSSKDAARILFKDRKSTRLNSSHVSESRMPSSA